MACPYSALRLNILHINFAIFLMIEHSRKIVGTWLLAGVFMIVIQTLLGGITRLTGSGLSITQWDLIMGSIPPLNHEQWQLAFDQYKQFPQYKIMNYDMSLDGFKNIFWWEFIHRLWARLFIPMFLIPLIIFLVKKWISKKLLIKLSIVFVLGGLQGLMGWIMVSSGLLDKPWVNPVNLSAHLVLALILLCYLFWIALEVLQPKSEAGLLSSLKPFSVVLLCLIFLQIFYGGLMAGNHAALFYPTWPKIGAGMIPHNIFQEKPWYLNLVNQAGMIQLIHRNLGYLVTMLIFIFFLIARKKSATGIFKRALFALPLLVFLQVLLGILTLLNSLGKIPIVFAVAHQMCAVLLLLTMMTLVYQISMAGKALDTAISADKKTMEMRQ